MQSHRPPSWKVLLLFVLFGPPIGALSVLLWMQLAMEPLASIEPSALFLFFAFAQIYGCVPALISGCTAALVGKVSSGNSSVQRALRLGIPAFIGAVWSVVLSLVINGPDTLVSISFGASGAIAALACGVLADFWVTMRPNNSLKRTNQSLRD